MKKARRYPARKLAPSHPGAMIGDILNDAGVSVRAAAGRMKVTPMALHHVINGKNAITPKMAVRLGAMMANGPETAEFWLRLQMEHDLWHARAELRNDVKGIAPLPRE